MAGLCPDPCLPGDTHTPTQEQPWSPRVSTLHWILTGTASLPPYGRAELTYQTH